MAEKPEWDFNAEAKCNLIVMKRIINSQENVKEDTFNSNVKENMEVIQEILRDSNENIHETKDSAATDWLLSCRNHIRNTCIIIKSILNESMDMDTPEKMNDSVFSNSDNFVNDITHNIPSQSSEIDENPNPIEHDAVELKRKSVRFNLQNNIYHYIPRTKSFIKRKSTLRCKDYYIKYNKMSEFETEKNDKGEILDNGRFENSKIDTRTEFENNVQTLEPAFTTTEHDKTGEVHVNIKNNDLANIFSSNKDFSGTTTDDMFASIQPAQIAVELNKSIEGNKGIVKNVDQLLNISPIKNVSNFEHVSCTQSIEMQNQKFLKKLESLIKHGFTSWFTKIQNHIKKRFKIPKIKRKIKSKKLFKILKKDKSTSTSSFKLTKINRKVQTTESKIKYMKKMFAESHMRITRASQKQAKLSEMFSKSVKVALKKTNISKLDLDLPRCDEENDPRCINDEKPFLYDNSEQSIEIPEISQSLKLQEVKSNLTYSIENTEKERTSPFNNFLLNAACGCDKIEFDKNNSTINSCDSFINLNHSTPFSRSENNIAMSSIKNDFFSNNLKKSCLKKKQNNISSSDNDDVLILSMSDDSYIEYIE